MIAIDPDVLTYDDERGFSLETFAVTGDFEPSVVAAAFDAAANRFMLVDETGTVHADFDSMQAAGVISAASYVSDAEVTERGVEIYIDCQGSVEDQVAVSLRTVARRRSCGRGQRRARRRSAHRGVAAPRALHPSRTSAESRTLCGMVERSTGEEC